MPTDQPAMPLFSKALANNAIHSASTAPWISKLGSGVGGADQRGDCACNASVNAAPLSGSNKGKSFESAKRRPAYMARLRFSG